MVDLNQLREKQEQLKVEQKILREKQIEMQKTKSKSYVYENDNHNDLQHGDKDNEEDAILLYDGGNSGGNKQTAGDESNGESTGFTEYDL